MLVAEILDKVRETLAAREANYDDPRPNFDRIAATWTVMLEAAGKLKPGEHIDGLDVARMMVCMKMCRDAFKYGDDNWFDTAGYAVCGLRIGSKDEKAVTDAPPWGDGPKWTVGHTLDALDKERMRRGQK